MIMKPIEQLQEILCTVESVEKDVKEWKIWTIIKYSLNDCLYTTTGIVFFNRFSEYVYVSPWHNYKTPKKIMRKNISKTIWNHINYKHLIVYCGIKWIDLLIDNWVITINWQGFIELDIILELYEQEDKVLLDIINFLKG